jgi:hypothetical protein
MILFEKRFHQGIVSGTTTLTFRAWKTARVKPGQRYRCHPIGVLEVDAVSMVTVADIGDADAILAGFASRVEILEYIAAKTGGGDQHAMVRVEFHHGGDGDRVDIALQADIDDATRKDIRAALARMDERPRTGPWTKKTLQLIGKHPRVAASKLAAMLGRETKDFKTDVVKLKKLGLTQSFEVGYEVSPRGLAFLQSQKRAK